MPLRVLLVDGSTTIKKVFKWALQDYGAEIFTVSVDETLLASIRTLKPDIIFLDTLLKGQSGYKLSTEIKSQKDLNSIPVVLLWNHFVPLEPEKFKNSKANEHLEKPFSIMVLREKVQKLVPKLKTQNLSQHLIFPKEDELNPPATPLTSLENHQTSPSDEISLERTAQGEENILTLEEEDNWVQKNVFKVSNPSSVIEDEESEKKLFLDRVVDELKPSSPLQAEKEDEKPEEIGKNDILELSDETESEKKKEKNTASLKTPHHLSSPNEEKIINQSKQVIESIAWKVVPELASQIIKKEIKRLLSEKEENL